MFHTGEVRVSPYLPFGGDNCNLLKASGMTTPKKDWMWLPVSCYLVEHPKGRILVDTGWHRDMSPDGVYDKKAQIKSLGSWILYHVNQGRIAAGLTRIFECGCHWFHSHHSPTAKHNHTNIHE